MKKRSQVESIRPARPHRRPWCLKILRDWRGVQLLRRKQCREAAVQGGCKAGWTGEHRKLHTQVQQMIAQWHHPCPLPRHLSDLPCHRAMQQGGAQSSPPPPAPPRSPRQKMHGRLDGASYAPPLLCERGYPMSGRLSPVQGGGIGHMRAHPHKVLVQLQTAKMEELKCHRTHTARMVDRRARGQRWLP